MKYFNKIRLRRKENYLQSLDFEHNWNFHDIQRNFGVTVDVNVDRQFRGYLSWSGGFF